MGDGLWSGGFEPLVSFNRPGRDPAARRGGRSAAGALSSASFACPASWPSPAPGRAPSSAHPSPETRSCPPLGRESSYARALCQSSHYRLRRTAFVRLGLQAPSLHDTWYCCLREAAFVSLGLCCIRSLHVAWVRPVGELCVAAATAATAAGPRGETHFRKRL